MNVKLDESELDMLIEALGIAAEKFVDIQRQLFELSRIQHNPQKKDRLNKGMEFHDVAYEFEELKNKLNKIKEQNEKV